MSFSENLLSLEEAMDLNFKKKTVFMGFTFWFIFPLMQDEDETDVKKKKEEIYLHGKKIIAIFLAKNNHHGIY